MLTRILEGLYIWYGGCAEQGFGVEGRKGKKRKERVCKAGHVIRRGGERGLLLA